jgi:pilus assembly protein CpaE
MSQEREARLLLMAPSHRRSALAEVLGDIGAVREADTPARVRSFARQERPDLVVLHADADPECLGLCADLDQSYGVRVLVIGRDAGMDALRAAMQAGARDYLAEPVQPGELRAAVARLAQVERRARRGHVVTVFGTKGGVGKSTLAANLAVVLSERHHQRVALCDLDLEFGCAATLFGIRPTATIVDVCRHPGAMTLAAIGEAMSHSDHSQVDILAGPPTPDLAAFVDGEGKRDPERNYVQEILRILRTAYDWVIVDTAVDFGEGVITALDEAERILFVTTPDIPALQNSAKGLDILLERLGYPQEKLSVVLNRGNAAMGLMEDEISAALSHPIRHALPSDGDAAVRAANIGMPLVLLRGRSPLARAVGRLGGDLVHDLERPRVAALGGEG